MLAQFGLKRKRSITHYEGIPIEFIMPPPAAAPKDRKLVTSRRLKALDKAMGNLCTGPRTEDVEVSPHPSLRDECYADC